MFIHQGVQKYTKLNNDCICKLSVKGKVINLYKDVNKVHFVRKFENNRTILSMPFGPRLVRTASATAKK